MLVNETLAAFSEQTATRTPTPGGGSVSAYVGALGAALGTMAARFSEGRPELAEHEAQLAADIARLGGLRARLLDLVDADARAYEGVRAAMALPKATPEAKAARRTAVQASLRAAMEPPRDAAQVALEGLEVLDGLRGRCNAHLLSDVGVGAFLLGAALRGAWVNVLVNLAGLKEPGLRETVLAEGEGWLSRGQALEDGIRRAVFTALTPSA